jgi:UTP-glucose-1-phosphate uridylyltransferase
MELNEKKRKPTLIILAAGMGSRFGGLKQVEPVGPNGEAIIDYTIYDAIRAGFGKVVFVIREMFADEFKAKFEKILKGKINTEYVYQELDNIPEGFTVSENREKPWGTAHAILVARNVVHEPFCALNADDFYGYNALREMADFLISSDDPAEYAAIGYKLSNTLSDYGSVSRGICKVNEYGLLESIVETTKIMKKDGNIISIEPDGKEKLLKGDETVSMNIWGFKTSIFSLLEEKLSEFLSEHINELKSEIYIPSVVFEIINENKARVKILETNSRWFGVTYKEDTPFVLENIRSLIEKGEYPEEILK